MALPRRLFAEQLFVLYSIELETVEAVRDAIKIKVAGGIATYDQAISFIQAGAGHIGTSRAVEIVEGFTKVQ